MCKSGERKEKAMASRAKESNFGDHGEYKLVFPSSPTLNRQQAAHSAASTQLKNEATLEMGFEYMKHTGNQIFQLLFDRRWLKASFPIP